MNKSIKINQINEILKKNFPGYFAVGSKPYSKGVLLIKTGAHPKIVQNYDSNHEALSDIKSPSFYPEHKRNKNELFDASETECKGLQLRNLGKTALDHFDEARELFSIFGIILPMNKRMELHERVFRIKTIKFK